MDIFPLEELPIQMYITIDVYLICMYKFITDSKTKFCVPTSAKFFVNHKTRSSLKIIWSLIEVLLGKRNLVECILKL